MKVTDAYAPSNSVSAIAVSFTMVRGATDHEVYGSWSEPYTLKETLNLDEIHAALRQYAIDYAAKNEPRFFGLSSNNLRIIYTKNQKSEGKTW